jgi:hypothetical protein
MQSPLATLACKWTHEDVHGLIVDTAVKFARQYGGEVDELVAEAQLLFMKNWRRYNPDCGSFSNFIRYYTWKGLLDTARKVAKDRARCVSMPRAELDRAAVADRATLGARLGELSADAQYVASLALRPPPDVRLSAAGRRGMEHPGSIRRAMIEFLEDMGWAGARVAEAFAEVKEALTP